MDYFIPHAREYELKLLREDTTFKEITTYCIPLIATALSRFIIPPEIYKKITAALISDVPIAAQRFLREGGEHKDYRFSTYFTWYIQERVKEYDSDVQRISPLQAGTRALSIGIQRLYKKIKRF